MVATTGLRSALTSPPSTSGRGLATTALPRPARPVFHSSHGQVGRRGRLLLAPPPRVWPFDLAWGTNLNLDSQVSVCVMEGEREREETGGAWRRGRSSTLNLDLFPRGVVSRPRPLAHALAREVKAPDGRPHFFLSDPSS